MATRKKTAKKVEKKAPAPKVEAPKAKAPKVEAPKAKAPKVEAPKAKAPKADVAAQALKTANEAAAATRKLRKQMEDEGVITNPHAMKTGGDLYREKKAALQGGSSRIAWLVVLAITCITVMGANVLRDGWGTGEPYGTFAVYGDRATDEATLVVDNVQAETVSGAAATDEVLSMGYATVTTDTTLTSAGSYFATTGAEMTLVLPDPDTMLGKNIRIVFSSDGGDLIVDTDSANTLFVAGDGGAADNRATMDTVLDTMSIQAISSTQWGVLDQTGAPVYTTQ